MTVLIEIQHLTKIYNRHRPDELRAINDVCLAVSRGEVLVLTGASGSGKTTLLSLIGCMARPTAGSVVVQGKEVSRLGERFLADIRRQTFGFIFQQYHLIKDISVLENILLPLYPGALSMREMKARAGEIMERLGIAARKNMKVLTLSGGEQQRVAIARSLINRPQIIMADEPTAHLDSALAAELLAILSEFQQEGKTVVIATHDPVVAGHSMVDRVVRMRDGRLVEPLTP